MTEPTWITNARRLVGLKETPGPASTPDVVQMWRDIRRSGIKDDSTPWCAAFVGAMLERAGIKSSRYESAASYLAWGSALSAPTYGCIVVFEHHVGFVVGLTVGGNLLVLGGNQSDAVNIRAFRRDRAVGYRWPLGVPVDTRPLPVGDAADVGSVR